MKLTINKERETPLLSRKRLTCDLEFEGATPARIVLKKELAKKANVDESLVVLKHIYTKFGKQKAKIIAHVYSNLEDLKKLEHASLIAKHSPKKKAGEEGAAPAAE